MATYLILATFIFLGYFVKSKKYYWFCFFLLFLFTAFRNTNVGGTDVLSYIYYFNTRIPILSSFSSYSADYEIGYALLNSIAKTLFGTFFSFQIVYTVVSITLLAVVIEKTKLSVDEKSLFLFVYFTFRYFLNAMGLLRQNIANEIVWIGLLDLFMIKEDGRYSLTSYANPIIAWLFHRSAIFNLLLYKLARVIKKHVNYSKVFITTIITSIICLMLSNGVINRLINIAISVGGNRYAKYLIEEGESVESISMINYAFRMLFFAFLYLGIDRLKYEKKDLVFIISSFAIVVGSINVAIFIRMLEYYMIGIYIAVTLSHRRFKGKSKSIYLLILYSGMMIILYRNLHSVSGGLYMNYGLMGL